MITCPECGASATENISGSSAVISCTKCDWSVARSWTEPINEDETEYELSLLEDNECTKEKLSAVSKVAGCGFVAARKLMGDPCGPIVKCLAVEMKRNVEILGSARVRFSITPDFPY